MSLYIKDFGVAGPDVIRVRVISRNDNVRVLIGGINMRIEQFRQFAAQVEEALHFAESENLRINQTKK